MSASIFTVKNEIENIILLLPQEVRNDMKKEWEKNKKMGIIHITQVKPYSIVYTDVAWCYTVAQLEFNSHSLQDRKNESISIEIGDKFGAMAKIYWKSVKHMEFLDKYIKNSLNKVLEENGLCRVNRDYPLQHFPDIQFLHDESGKMAIISLSYGNHVILSFEHTCQIVTIPRTTTRDFDAIRKIFGQNFANIKEAEKYVILEKGL